jgi:hypothetical protein
LALAKAGGLLGVRGERFGAGVGAVGSRVIGSREVVLRDAERGRREVFLVVAAEANTAK